jgi:hypothetical protein
MWRAYMKFWKRCLISVILLVGAGLVGCSAAKATPTPETYTDPFAYCAAVGTIDAPGPDYTGPRVPESVAVGLQEALNAPDTPISVLENGSDWRCMDGHVYACFVGANLPCKEKVDTDRTPTQAEKEYCQQNANADVIPAAVTGRATAYEWQCKNGAPEMVRQVAEPDERGFFSNIWYEISPN